MERILKFWKSIGINYNSPEWNSLKAAQFFNQYKLENELSGKKNDVSFPLIYIGFHSNDLALFSGLGITSLLILICFSFNREFKNLETVFKKGRKNKTLKETYTLLAMKQVLTVPPNLKSRLHKVNLLSILTKLILLIPIFIQSIIWFNDFSTYKNTLSLESDLTIQQLILSFGLLISVTSFSIWCILVTLDIDTIWKQAAYDILERKVN